MFAGKNIDYINPYYQLTSNDLLLRFLFDHTLIIFAAKC